jgi:hypothetical protein
LRKWKRKIYLPGGGAIKHAGGDEKWVDARRVHAKLAKLAKFKSQALINAHGSVL